MRYRQLTPSGDGTMFSGNTQFLVDSPAAVAQAVLTKLKLWQGEWFLDSSVGTPYTQQVLGTGTQNTRDIAIQSIILGTEGVLDAIGYQSSVNGRQFTVNVQQLITIYGSTELSVSL